MAYELAGKVALITGGALGIGEELVKLLRKHGVKVASMDIADHREPADSTFLPIKASVASEDECNRTVQQVLEQWGRIDILVNNAGVMDNMKGVTETSNDLWHHVLNVNLHGPMQLMRSGIANMLKNEGPHKGVVVNVSSVTSLRGAVSGAAYCTAKTALNALGRNTAWIYRNDGIRCNTVLPGGVETNIIKNSNSTFKTGDEASPQAPMHACMVGMCSALDVAESILYLITATSVNGEELVIDKGWMMA